MSVVAAISELLDLANEIQCTALAWVGNPAIDGKVLEERRALRRRLASQLRKRIDVANKSRRPAGISISEMLEALNSFAAAVEGVLNWECQWALTPEGIQSIRDAKRRAGQPPIWADNPEMRPYHPSNVASLTAYTRLETRYRERLQWLQQILIALQTDSGTSRATMAPQDGAKPAKPHRGKLIENAIAILIRDGRNGTIPSDLAVAEEAGCSRSTLYRSDEYRETKKTLRNGSRREKRRGYKTSDGRIEAPDE